MAFTKTPIQSSAQTQTVPLLYKWDSRDDSTHGYDTQMKNALVEMIGEEYFQVMKRDGTEIVATNFNIPGPIIGLYYWDRTIQAANGGRFMVVVYVGPGNTAVYVIFRVTSSPFVNVGSGALGGTISGDEFISFQEFLYQNGKTDLLININATGGSISKITGDTFLATNIVCPINGRSITYLDGYLFGTNQQAIFNSALNDPTTWPPSNFLAADSYADNIERLARVGPYLVAFGTESIQYFYDAANPTGSPISANVGATKHIGYLGGFASMGDDNYFVGQSANGAPSLYKLNGLRVDEVASMPFARMWISQANKLSSLGVNTDGALLTLNGHSCYYVRTASTSFPFPGPGPAPVGESYIYDLSTGLWSRLGYQALDYYLIKTYVQLPGPIGTAIMTYTARLGSTDITRFSPTIYQDNGTNFEVKFRTKPYDFGTLRLKFGSRLMVSGDQTSSSSLASVSWSDDDYKTTSTPRRVDMQYAYQQLYALGSFRKRSFTLTYTDNFPMRWKTIELDYDQGNA